MPTPVHFILLHQGNSIVLFVRDHTQKASGRETVYMKSPLYLARDQELRHLQREGKGASPETRLDHSRLETREDVCYRVGLQEPTVC